MAAHHVTLIVKVRSELTIGTYFEYFIAVADSPGEGGMACNCSENQVCLRTGRFGTPECVNRKSACSIFASTA